MDPPLVNEASFTAAANPSSYSLAGLLSFPVSGCGLKMGSHGGDGSIEESTVTEQSGGKRRRGDIIGSSNFLNNHSNDGSSNKLSSIANHDLIESSTKRTKASGSIDENGDSKTDAEANSGTEKIKLEPPKDYIHVRARRGQATDSHSLAERARREKISERMKILQDLVPGCNKVIGKALVLDEIINYIQSLQRQVEFLSMKLEAVNSRLNPTMDGFPPKDLTTSAFDANGIIYGSQNPREYGQGTQMEWLHMQVGSGYERVTEEVPYRSQN